MTSSAAIYILAEIGQEKQLDVNHEGFMGYEEPIPLTSSSSLSLVRLLIKLGQWGSVVVDYFNTFKYIRAIEQKLPRYCSYIFVLHEIYLKKNSAVSTLWLECL